MGLGLVNLDLMMMGKEIDLLLEEIEIRRSLVDDLEGDELLDEVRNLNTLDTKILNLKRKYENRIIEVGYD